MHIWNWSTQRNCFSFYNTQFQQYTWTSIQNYYHHRLLCQISILTLSIGKVQTFHCSYVKNRIFPKKKSIESQLIQFIEDMFVELRYQFVWTRTLDMSVICNIKIECCENIEAICSDAVNMSHGYGYRHCIPSEMLWETSRPKQRNKTPDQNRRTAHSNSWNCRPNSQEILCGAFLGRGFG